MKKKSFKCIDRKILLFNKVNFSNFFLDEFFAFFNNLFKIKTYSCLSGNDF